MKREELENRIIKEHLGKCNLGDRDIRSSEVGVFKKEDGWHLYYTDERREMNEVEVYQNIEVAYDNIYDSLKFDKDREEDRKNRV